MSIPHPFRAIRRAGSPSSGGNAHTLGAHMASRSPHPIYVKKGDKVGSVDLAAHNADRVSHRRFFLRRGELATTLDHYNNSIVDAVAFSGETPNALQNTYPTIVTTNLLRLILGSIGTYAPSILSTSAIIANNEGKIPGSTAGTYVSLTDEQLKSYVPGYNVFKELYTLAQSYKKTGGEYDSNPLKLVFASYQHRHDGTYSLLGHTHGFDEVVDAYGRTPAYEGHDHDDRYVLKGSGTGGTSADLSVLEEVGIYPEAATFEKPGIYFDRFNVQGTFAFTIDAATDVNDAPADFASGLTAVTSGIRGTCILDVLRGTTDYFVFGTTKVDTFITKNHSLTHRHNLATQFLTTDAASLYKSGSTYLPGANLRNFYIRRGYSMDTSWYISTILKRMLDMSPNEFYNISSDVNIADQLSEKINEKLDNDYRKTYDASKEDIAIPGLVSPTALSDNSRVGRIRWEIGKVSPKLLSPKASDLSAAADSRYTDWVSWLATKNRESGTATVAFNASKTPYECLRMATAYTGFSDLVHYYKGSTVYTKLTNLNDSILFSSGNYAYQNGTEKVNIVFDVSPHTCYLCNVPSTVDRVIDDTNLILHEYRQINDEDAVFETGNKYYEKGDNDVYGIPTFTEYTDWDAGDPIEPGTLYKKVALLMTDHRHQWSKKPVQAGVDLYDASKTYYKYDYALYKFVAIGGVSGVIVGGSSVVEPPGDYNGPIFTDYDLFTYKFAYSRLMPSSVDYTASISTTNTKFQSRFTYYKKVGANKVKITLNPLTKNTQSFNSERRYIIKNEVTGELTNTNAAVDATAFATISGSLGANEAIYYIQIDTETNIYRSTEETIPTDGNYFIGVPSYTESFTSTTDPVYQLAYFIRTTDTVSKSGKKYFVMSSDKFFERDTALNTPGTSFTGIRYEAIGLEDFFDIWLACYALTNSVTSTPTNENACLPVYDFGNDGEFIAWEPWERVITNADASYSAMTGGSVSLSTGNYEALSYLTTLKEGSTIKGLKFNGNELATKSSVTTLENRINKTSYTDIKLVDSMIDKPKSAGDDDDRDAWFVEKNLTADPNTSYQYSVYLVLNKKTGSTVTNSRVVPNPLAEIESSSTVGSTTTTTTYVVNANNLFFFISKPNASRSVILFKPKNWIDITGSDSGYETEVWVRKTPLYNPPTV